MGREVIAIAVVEEASGVTHEDLDTRAPAAVDLFTALVTTKIFLTRKIAVDAIAVTATGTMVARVGTVAVPMIAMPNVPPGNIPLVLKPRWKGAVLDAASTEATLQLARSRVDRPAKKISGSIPDSRSVLQLHDMNSHTL
jgi:hypothetical protein